jgi:hypothetical protein
VVEAGGRLVRGNAVAGGRESATGTYVVEFATPVSACAYTATLGTATTTATSPGRVTVSDLGGKVGVQTFDPSGAPADLPFHLVVAC